MSDNEYIRKSDAILEALTKEFKDFKTDIKDSVDKLISCVDEEVKKGIVRDNEITNNHKATKAQWFFISAILLVLLTATVRMIMNGGKL